MVQDHESREKSIIRRDIITDISAANPHPWMLRINFDHDRSIVLLLKSCMKINEKEVYLRIK